MNSKIVFILTWCLFVISSCSTYDNEVHLSPVNNSFRLVQSNYEGQDVTKSSSEALAFQRASYYILDKESQIVENISISQTNDSSLLVEDLLDGDYFLIVLAEKTKGEDSDVEIHTLSGGDDKWLTINSPQPIKHEIFYAKHPFKVSGGVVEQNNVFLKRIVARVDFNVVLDEYAEGVVDKIIIMSDKQYFTNTFYANNSYSGESLLDTFSLTEDRSILLFPSEDLRDFSGTVQIFLNKSYGRDPVVHSYPFSISIDPNKLSKVTINATDISCDIGTLFMDKDDFNESNLDHILKDDEPKEVYTNREFRINKPVQVRVNESKKMDIYFYSPVGINNVQIWGKIKDIEEKIEIANIEYIPAFAEIINLPFTLTQKETFYRTMTGAYIEIPKYENLSNEDITFEVVSSDPYWEKIQQINTSWSIRFSLFDGDPDKPSGRPDDIHPGSNWMGIRPVHCREAVAILTNVAYMITLSDFEEHLYSFQGRIMGNGGKGDVLDLKKVIPGLENHSGFNVGLVYSGNGTIGLGGGRTWGVYQNSFFNHYTSTYACNTIFHEFGHCIGYNHDSGMTYGPWAEECAGTFYVDNIERFPVNKASYLSSNSNSHKYE